MQRLENEQTEDNEFQLSKVSGKQKVTSYPLNYHLKQRNFSVINRTGNGSKTYRAMS